MMRPTGMFWVAAVAASVGCASGGSEPPPQTPPPTQEPPEVEPPPVAGGPMVEGHRNVGEPGCTLDAPAPVRDERFAVLEVSGGLTGASKRYEMGATGNVDVSGYGTQGPRQVTVPGGADRTGELLSSIEETGIYDLPTGCYGPSPEGPDYQVETVVLLHDGRVRKYAVTNRQGPDPLVHTILLLHEYLREGGL